MRTIMIRYKTTEAHAEPNAARVRAVFNELATRAPACLRYATYRLADGATFLHIATTDAKGANPLLALASFRAFQTELAGRCVEPPVVTELTSVGAYGPSEQTLEVRP